MNYLPTILYLASAALFVATVVTSNTMLLLGGAILMFAASIATKMTRKK